MQVNTILLSAEKDVDKDTQAISTEVCLCTLHGWELFRLFSVMVSDSAHGLHLVILHSHYNLNVIFMYNHSLASLNINC